MDCWQRFEKPKYRHLRHRGPKNNRPFLLTIAILCTETVNKCLWLQMARMEMD